MTAKEKFSVGQRVQFTSEAIAKKIPTRNDKTNQGIVIGFGRLSGADEHVR